MTHTITIIGLGNYDIDDLPLGIYRFIQKQDKIYARTLEHPVIESLKVKLILRALMIYTKRMNSLMLFTIKLLNS